jgi:8-oxo-dGTP pyrophosphatase MutT (NUDIX family)
MFKNLDFFSNKISTHIDACGLPGENAHLAMSPYGRIPASALDITRKNKARTGAVLMLLYGKKDKIFTLLIKRPDYDGPHSGQMAFPGGKKDDNDLSLWHTASRETHEETGIHENLITPICGLTPVFIPVSNFLVQPYLGIIKAPFQLNPDPREVAFTVEFPIDILLNDEIIKTTKVDSGHPKLRMNTPYFEIENQIVWGATAVILNEFKELIKCL